ncbi:hypothetical protein D3C80_1037260 [compost metagenome]
MAAHQAHGRPRLGLGKSGPEVGTDDQVVEALDVLVIGRLPCAADRVAGAGEGLGEGAGLAVEFVELAAQVAPGGVFGFTGEQVDTQAETHRAALLVGQFAHPFDMRFELLNRLCPVQVDIGVTGGHVQRRVGETGEVHAGFAFVAQVRRQGAVLQAVDVAVVGEAFVVPQPLDDVEELASALVALVVVEKVALGTLAGRVAAGDDVPVQAPVAQVLEDRCLLGGVGGQGPGGLEGDQKAQPAGFPGQGRGGDPRLGAGGQQRAFEACKFRGLGHLGDVVDVGETVGAAVLQQAGGDMPGRAAEAAAVVFVGAQLRAVGAQGQTPEEFGAHGCSSVNVRAVVQRPCHAARARNHWGLRAGVLPGQQSVSSGCGGCSTTASLASQLPQVWCTQIHCGSRSCRRWKAKPSCLSASFPL